MLQNSQLVFFFLFFFSFFPHAIQPAWHYKFSKSLFNFHFSFSFHMFNTPVLFPYTHSLFKLKGSPILSQFFLPYFSKFKPFYSQGKTLRWLNCAVSGYKFCFPACLVGLAWQYSLKWWWIFVFFIFFCMVISYRNSLGGGLYPLL